MKTALVTAFVSLILLPLHAGDFKRFYPADSGEEITALRALPGDGVLLTSKLKQGPGTIDRVLLPERQLSIRLPDGAMAVAASSDYGVIFTAGGRLYRKPVGPLGPVQPLEGGSTPLKVTEVSAKGFTLQPEGAAPVATAPAPKWPAALHPCDPAAAKTPLLISPDRIMLSRDNGRDLLVVEQIEGGKVIIDHGQCGGEFIWTLISTSRGALLLPARRTVQIYNPADGARLAKTTVSRDMPHENILVPWRPLGEKGAAHLIVLAGPGLEWWGPLAKHLEQWGEVIVSPDEGAKN